MKPGHSATAEELIEWCRARLGALQVPAPCRLRRNPQDVDRQGAEIRAARAGEADRGGASLTRCVPTPGRNIAAPRSSESVSAAAAQFPGPGEEAPKRVHDVRKTLKEARAIARLFLDCVGEPARVTITTLAATRRQIGRARDLDVMALRVQRLEPPPEVSEPLMAAIAREREAAQRARRGLCRQRAAARLNAIVRRVEGWDLSAVGTEDDRRRGRAHLPAGARARAPRLRRRRSGRAACVSRPRGRSALPALASCPARGRRR